MVRRMKKLLGVFLLLLAVTGMVLNKFIILRDGFLSEYWWLVFGIPVVLFVILKLVPADED